MALTKVRGGGVGNPLTLGGGSASDNSIIFDGNAQDFHIGLDDSTDSLTIGLGSTLGTTSHMVIDANGHITKPLQSAFLVFSIDANDFPLNDNRVFTLDTEVFDQNGDVASNVFTAPVTGRYNLSFSAYFTAIASDSNYLEMYLITSNKTYYFIIDPGTFDQTGAYHTITASVLADMDANDTASIRYRQSSGTQGTDFNGSDSFFCGYLVC
tara:strand:- start:374 stop:1006 length:633 start_codon:yes stop_codon:yes gene_type:complete